MKKMFSIIIVCLFFVCVMTGCVAPKNEEAREIPVLQLEYIVNGYTHTVDAYMIFCFWDDITYNIAIQDTLDIAQNGVLPEIENNENINELRLTFSKTPDSFSVWRWEDIFIGNREGYEQFYNYEQSYETVGIFDNIIDLSDDNMGYVYEIRASWTDCDVYYAFHVKVK